MADQLTWEPPGPGPWQHDQSHFPYMISKMGQEILPAPFARGFSMTLNRYGALLDGMNPTTINGFLYMQPHPFDAPGPDGPKSEEWVHEEFGRRIGVAAAAVAGQVWFDDLRQWDEELKPASIAKHDALHSTDMASLSDEDFIRHLEERAAHLGDMVFQHHRFNVSALFPIGDFALQASAMTHMSPVALLAVLDGSSPVSGMMTPELAPAVAAVKADPSAVALVRGPGDPAARLAELRTKVPAVDEWMRHTEYRIIDGLDVTRPTMSECPALALGRLEGAMECDPEAANRRATEFAASLRERVPAEQRALFDDLLASARKVNRLRDERAIYSDTSGVGLLRLGMLEAGRRLVARGVLDDPAEALEAGLGELTGLLRGASTPTAADLRERTAMRGRLGSDTAPHLIGPPPPPPPPADQLPPPLARVMSAVGFSIEGVLGEMPSPTGDSGVVIGIGIGSETYEGRAFVVTDFDQLMDIEEGDVLVTPATMESFNAMLHLVGAIVTDHGSYASHAAIMARELGFPAIVGTVNGTKRIHTGDRVRVDGAAGTVTVVH